MAPKEVLGGNLTGAPKMLEATLPSGPQAGMTVEELCHLVHDPWNVFFRLKGPQNAKFRAYGKVLKTQATFEEEYRMGFRETDRAPEPASIALVAIAKPMPQPRQGIVAILPRAPVPAGADNNNVEVLAR